MKLPIFQVDAFTSRLFSGNPAAVVLLDEQLPDETLQAVAAENNLSETAFVLPKGEALGLRWFTPRIEVDLCGHATLATAFVLFEEGKVRGDKVVFETKSCGLLTVKKDGPDLFLDFPSRAPAPAQCTEKIASALGGRPKEAHAAERDLLVLYETEDEILALQPDLIRVEALDAFAVIATAKGNDVDFVSRFFAPRAGIPEDPVTGSAHCTLIPFWAGRLGKQKLRARQVSERGGELLCEHLGERVSIGGRAKLYLRGEIVVD